MADAELTVGDGVALTDAAIRGMFHSKKGDFTWGTWVKLRGKVVKIEDGRDPTQPVGNLYVHWNGEDEPWSVALHPRNLRRVTIKKTAIPYREALAWIIKNDDCEWLAKIKNDEHNEPPLVTACLVADIYGRSTDEVVADLVKMMENGT